MIFTSPEYFLIIPALALVGWFWRELKLQTPLRAVLMVLAVVALTEPIIQHQQNSLGLYVLLDRSDSTEDLIDKGLPEWQRLRSPQNPTVAIRCGSSITPGKSPSLARMARRSPVPGN